MSNVKYMWFKRNLHKATLPKNWHFVQFGAPPVLCTTVAHANYKQNLLRWKCIYVPKCMFPFTEVTCRNKWWGRWVADTVSLYYNTLYQQHDFEAVILRLEKKKKLHNVALKCKTTAMLNLFSCRFILSRTDARKLLLSHVANLFYNRSQWLIHCVMHYIMHRYRTQIFTWFIYSRCRLKSFCSLRAE